MWKKTAIASFFAIAVFVYDKHVQGGWIAEFWLLGSDIYLCSQAMSMVLICSTSGYLHEGDAILQDPFGNVVILRKLGFGNAVILIPCPHFLKIMAIPVVWFPGFEVG